VTASGARALLVGLDVGTSAVKAIAIDARSGEVVASASRPLDLETPRPGFAEQDPRTYCDESIAALAALAHRLGPRRDAVAAIGLSGQMHTAVFLDAARLPLGPAMLWCDGRATEACAEILAAVGTERLAATVGNRPLEGFTLPKLLWLRRHQPEVFARVDRVVMPKDFVRYRLTGELGTDRSDASGTLAFDQKSGRFSDEVLDRVGAPRDVWPAAHGSAEIAGALLDDVAASTGLPPRTPVAFGAADNAAAAVGLGVVRAGRAMASIGTSGVVLAHADTFDVGADLPLHTFAHALPGRFYQMGVMLAAGGALRWYRDVLCDGEKLAAELRAADAYDVIVDSASTARPGANGLLFLPYLSGERTPHHDVAARGAFVGLGAHTSKADLSRAVLEGITFGLKDSLDLLRAQGPIELLRFTGGGAKSQFWRQLVADVLEVEVALTTSSEGPAFGAAILAGVGAGVFASIEDAADALVHVTARSLPDPIASARYRAIHAEYRALYGDLRGRFRALGSLA
jgi:xylulokinase